MHRLLRSRVLLAVLAVLLALAAGARLAQAGAAPVLLFSDGGSRDSSSGRLCLQRVEGVRVLCLHPEIDTTRGEARASPWSPP